VERSDAKGGGGGEDCVDRWVTRNVKRRREEEEVVVVVVVGRTRWRGAG
jgi:hypothetical protein